MLAVVGVAFVACFSAASRERDSLATGVSRSNCSNAANGLLKSFSVTVCAEVVEADGALTLGTEGSDFAIDASASLFVALVAAGISVLWSLR